MQVEAGGVLALPWSYHEAPDAADPIWISLRHETVGWAEVLLPHWPDAPVTLKLQPGATLSCRVLDDAGKPQEGATVSLRRWAQKADVGLPRLLHDDYCQTDAAGRAVFIQVPPGVYNLTAQVGPWQPLVKDVTVGKANLDVTLQPPVTPVDGITGVHVQLAPQQRTGGLQQERP